MDLRVPTGWFFLLLGAILDRHGPVFHGDGSADDCKCQSVYGNRDGDVRRIDALAVETDIVREAFRKTFGGSNPAHVFRAPGRVNLIGEHTDYNLGFVCPIAIHLACFVAAAPSKTGDACALFGEHQ